MTDEAKLWYKCDVLGLDQSLYCCGLPFGQDHIFLPAHVACPTSICGVDSGADIAYHICEPSCAPTHLIQHLRHEARTPAPQVPGSTRFTTSTHSPLRFVTFSQLWILPKVATGLKVTGLKVNAVAF